MRVFCFSGMPFNCPIVGDEKYVRVCCYWIRRTYFSSMPFSLHYCCGRELSSFVVNGLEGHAIQVQLHPVFDRTSPFFVLSFDLACVAFLPCR